MRTSIFAIGRMKAGPEKQLLDHYRKQAERAGRGLHLFGPTITEFSESRKSTATQRKEEEAELLCKAIGGDTKIIALDETGNNLTSDTLAQFIASTRDGGVNHLAFAIGGPDGHGPKLLNRAAKTVALGQLTWPHQLARILLCEQLYRACTIISGHPYHRS